MAKNTALKLFAVIAILAFACGIVGTILGGIALDQNKKDDLNDLDHVTLTGHWDSTLNETLTAEFWSDGEIVSFEVKSWNGTFISSGGTYLTSSFDIPAAYLPKNFNATTAEAFISPVFPVYVQVATLYRTWGYAFVNPLGQLSIYRDASNATSAFSFNNLRGQIYPFSGQYARKFNVNYI